MTKDRLYSLDEIMELLVSMQWKHDHAGYAYIKRSHAVLWFTERRVIQASELVHHKNENKADDRPENLEVLTKSEHARLHYDEKLGAANKRPKKHSDEHKERLRQKMLGNTFARDAGYQYSAEKRARISEQMKEIWRRRKAAKAAEQPVVH